MEILSSINEDYIKKIIHEKKQPAWLNDIRENAFAKYISLPSEVSPLYTKYSDVNQLRPDHIRIHDRSIPSEPYEDLKNRLSELENGTSVLYIGSSINRLFIADNLSKQGVIISDINEAMKEHEDLLKKRLTITNQLNYGEDKFLALTGSAYQSGIFIYIPKNTIITDPIRIISSLADDGTSSIARNVIVADVGSSANIVQEIYSPQTTDMEHQQAYFELLECHVDQNAHLEMVTLQAMSEQNINFSNRKAFVENDGKISWYLGMFGSQLSRYKIDSIMKGPGSSAEDVEIIFGIGKQAFDITSNLIHIGHNSRGRVMAKSVMKDASKSLFKGMIKIGKEAKSSESYLAGHAILLDRGAKSDAIPGLEIETNEVKATHSASVAQLDEMQIFYLMCRGLSREGAKREIVNGFLEPLSRKMGPTIRAWINYLIDNKWSGKPLMLKVDEAMEQILEVEKSRYRETQDIFEKHYKYR